MSFIRSNRTAFTNYANFSGRANRREFWYFLALTVFILAATTIIDGAVIGPMRGYLPFEHEAGRPLSLAALVALFLPSLSISVRRMHDFNRSGWWVLLAMIPIAGVLVLLVWFAIGGDKSENRFGLPRSKAN